MKNPIKNIYRSIGNYFINKVPYTDLVLAIAKGRGTSAPSDIINHQAKILRVETLKDWKMGVMLATNPENPEKAKLRALYDSLEQDNHLGSTIETRIAKTQQSPFKIVNQKGERVDELKALFEGVWFQDFIKYVLMSKFQGTTLVELFHLDENGELSEVTEIGQAYFNPVKGIILKEAGDTTGTPYKEGNLANYYIQIGKDYNDLGLYALVAPIVLAKKLGLGSWLDFIEKYGVPPLFITTDREDDTRLMELFEMATHFRRNAFMVGRGQEKFEVPNITTHGSNDVFDGLIKRADNEISKRFLGGTGLTDEKGFVGSVEVQFELASYRFQSDKLLVKHIINKKLFPLLVKLSPVYSKLSGLRFEWDDDEPMTTEKFLQSVQTLGYHFELDPEQVENITGVKILGVKNNQAPVFPEKK
ncbi:DUF935 family protein [Capnocytophaga sp. H2931]|uniref:phage portal protein family protein n=1 Tax=Capnocytophaga sp. H2931 TaxID=1945657 RepID=UPI000BB1E070|nr:DUF935 family protein [Capnocytophaga sp. H2931]ATA75236.1 hypothetical protein CGC52_07315 [Capnocytophaga sp. H2931]